MTANQRVTARRAIAVLNVLVLSAIAPGAPGLWPTVALAWQDENAPPPLRADQIETLVAQIALYPDPLLAQVLAAATFPTDVVQADRWAAQHKNLKGQQLSDAIVQANLPYDPSVISLIQFPTVLSKLSKELDWTNALGNAVLAQRGDVMDAIQRMRRKAEQAGNLKSGNEIKVVSSPTVIEIQPANPQVVQVPAYNPQVVYAPPPAGPSTGAVVATGLISFGLGVAVGAAANNSCCWYGGSIGWHSHTVVVANTAFSRTWATRAVVPPPPPYYRASGPYPVGRPPIGGAYGNTAYRSNVAYRGNTNVNNVNVNVNNANRANVNRSNVNNATRSANVNTVAANRSANVAGAPTANTQSVNRLAAANQGAPRNIQRGYSQPASSGRATAFSGAQNGRSEIAASARGRRATRR